MALFDLLWEALFAVFDGHGGSQVSHIASKEFPKAGLHLLMLVLLGLLELSLFFLMCQTLPDTSYLLHGLYGFSAFQQVMIFGYFGGGAPSVRKQIARR
jgi:hypothetical protein